jgi:hypothetical protein
MIPEGTFLTGSGFRTPRTYFSKEKFLGSWLNVHNVLYCSAWV